jgi:membrane protein involved in colicin uptake
MNALFRILGTAAAVAVSGVAVAAVSKWMEKDSPLYVASTEFPERAENDPETAAEAAQAYADAARKEADAAQEKAYDAQDAADAAQAKADRARKLADEAQEKADAAKADAQAEEPAEADSPAPAAPIARESGPNPNPVDAGPATAPKGADGKFDPTQIAQADDFANWEEMGCQG